MKDRFWTIETEHEIPTLNSWTESSLINNLHTVFHISLWTGRAVDRRATSSLNPCMLASQRGPTDIHLLCTFSSFLSRTPSILSWQRLWWWIDALQGIPELLLRVIWLWSKMASLVILASRCCRWLASAMMAEMSWAEVLPQGMEFPLRVLVQCGVGFVEPVCQHQQFSGSIHRKFLEALNSRSLWVSGFWLPGPALCHIQENQQIVAFFG